MCTASFLDSSMFTPCFAIYIIHCLPPTFTFVFFFLFLFRTTLFLEFLFYYVFKFHNIFSLSSLYFKSNKINFINLVLRFGYTIRMQSMFFFLCSLAVFLNEIEHIHTSIMLYPILVKSQHAHRRTNGKCVECKRKCEWMFILNGVVLSRCECTMYIVQPLYILNTFYILFLFMHGNLLV